MSRTASLRRISALALATTLVFAACGDDDDAASSSTDPATATDTGDTGTGDTDTGDGDGVPSDVCTIISADDVAAIIGEPNVVSETTPSGGCYFSSDETSGLYPTIEIAEDFDGAGGIEGAQSGAEATLSTTAETITVGDDTGYFATGAIGSGEVSIPATQAAISHDGLIITLSMNGEAAATRQDAAIELLALAVAGL